MISKIPKQYKDQLYAIGAYASKLGLKAWVVGGAVRDFYLKKSTLDIDLAFDGNQESVAGFCVKQWGGGKRKFSQFGTFRVNLDNGLKLDMVRARKETYPYPGSLPVVSFSKEMKDDLFRRDFTTNAWCFSILPQNFGQPYDPFGARKDIDAGIVRILHDKSFLDDPTRMFRAVRFAGRFGWRLAPKTERLLREAVKDLLPQRVLWRKKSPYPKTWHPLYRQCVSERMKELLTRADAPLFVIVKKERVQDLLQEERSVPWYGQLMTTPQTIAYLLQLNYWLEHYHVEIQI